MTSRRQLFQGLALLLPPNLRGSWLLETAYTKRRKSMKVRHDLASKNANQRSAPWLRLIIRETNVLRAVYFESNDAESEEVATTPTEARRCTQNLPLRDLNRRHRSKKGCSGFSIFESKIWARVESPCAPSLARSSRTIAPSLGIRAELGYAFY